VARRVYTHKVARRVYTHKVARIYLRAFGVASLPVLACVAPVFLQPTLARGVVGHITPCRLPLGQVCGCKEGGRIGTITSGRVNGLHPLNDLMYTNDGGGEVMVGVRCAPTGRL
jgi:hypothetical protein